MLIENPDSLKAWLTAIIEPLCDADPSALAKYVIALIKKDKAIGELRISMEEQMDVFLQGETKKFTRELFEALESKSYLLHSPKTPPSTEGQEAPESSSKQPHEEDPKAATTTTSPSEEDSRRQESPLKGNRLEDSERNSTSRRRRSRSPFRGSRRRFRSRSPPPYSVSNSSSKRRRSPYNGRRTSPSHRSRRGGDSLSPPPLPPPSTKDLDADEDESNGYTPSSNKKRAPRCRDYDEKGFCMRGDMCKYDHGSDAVVLEDNAASGPPSSSSVPPPYLPYAPPGSTTAAAPTDPYVPTGGSSLLLPPLHVPPPGYAVPPSEDKSSHRKRGYEGGPPEGYPPNKRFDYSRLGRPPPPSSLNGRPAALKLAVRNIPPPLNNIASLNNHFARFGTLVNVQVGFEGDPGSALVTFAKPQEAQGAFSSSEAVMGNRFIKMYFYHERRPYSQGGKPSAASFSHISVKERLGDNNASLENGKAKDENGASNKADEKAAEIAAIQKSQEILQANAEAKRLQEVKAKEAAQRLSELARSKQSLLEKLIAQQKVLILKFEKSEDSAEKSEILKLSKSLSAQIDSTREDVKATITAKVRKTPGEIQKELLDAELELFNVQQSGGSDASELQKKVNALKIDAARQGVLPTSQRPHRGRFRGGSSSFRGYGLYRGRGRGRGGFGLTSVDRRPSKILVTGFEAENKEQVLVHFQKFGEVLDSAMDEAVPSLVVHFKLRREAENAMVSGKSFRDRILELSWHTATNSEDFSSGDLMSKQCVDSTVLDEEDDYTPLDPAYIPPGLEENNEASLSPRKEDEEKDKDEEELNADDLLYDGPGDEEDDEEEERSWKR
eukprot:TRINITY_DN18726_c0_g1_i1.p1 TRINITY_DN18726_c0_g1~~TRINITY_DN18726_c0_g1_i1.p1  ORF type:complete len:838 (-),score=312.60 TRINITY_DN18726_c0_g1_i1:518-3031(-)